MRTRLFMVSVVLVYLSPQQTLDFSSNSGIQPTVKTTALAIQRTVEVATPWFQLTAAGFTVLKYGTEFLDKKDKDDDSDG